VALNDPYGIKQKEILFFKDFFLFFLKINANIVNKH